MIEGGLDALFADNPNVFVAGDLLWYPVEGKPSICTAPDAMVVFGRPKGDRRSYLQWQEGNLPPQVTFEVLSHTNTAAEMKRKLQFYERHGVDEYYLYDPDRGTLNGWLRDGDTLVEIGDMQHWISPRLNIEFQLQDGELVIYGPDGTRFATYVELAEQVEQERLQRESAQQQALQERLRAEQERRRAEQERERAEQERERAEQERERAERLAVQLRALGIDPDTL
jgi:hypothetical protein